MAVQGLLREGQMTLHMSRKHNAPLHIGITDDADLSLEGIDLLFPIGDDVLNALQKQVHFVDLSVALLQLGFQTGNDRLREYKPRRPFQLCLDAAQFLLEFLLQLVALLCVKGRERRQLAPRSVAACCTANSTPPVSDSPFSAA